MGQLTGGYFMRNDIVVVFVVVDCYCYCYC